MLRIVMSVCLVVSAGVWLLAADESNVPAGGKSNPESQTRDDSEQPGTESPGQLDSHDHDHEHEHEHEAVFPDDDQNAGPFAAAIVGITLKSDPSYTVYLKEAEVRRLGQQSFLVGLGADSGTGVWMVGRRSWVAIDDIAEILEFESEEELQEILSEDPEAFDPDA
jgi:hypothetical protein